MDYVKLIFGIVLIAVYTWTLITQVKRSTFTRSLLHFDLVIGIVAGLYIVISSTISIVT